jgi:hypothetical protein
MVKVVHQGSFMQGDNRFLWQCDEETNNQAAPGIYIIRLNTNKSTSAIRVQKI